MHDIFSLFSFSSIVHISEANNSLKGCQYRYLSHPLCLYGPHILLRSHLSIRLTYTPEHNIKSRFLPFYHRFRPSRVEVSRSIRQRPHNHRIHFRWKRMYLCSITSTLLAGSVGKSTEVL
jgi:hypothetical protein